MDRPTISIINTNLAQLATDINNLVIKIGTKTDLSDSEYSNASKNIKNKTIELDSDLIQLIHLEEIDFNSHKFLKNHGNASKKLSKIKTLVLYHDEEIINKYNAVIAWDQACKSKNFRKDLIKHYTEVVKKLAKAQKDLMKSK
jgi:hypothetical protein